MGTIRLFIAAISLSIATRSCDAAQSANAIPRNFKLVAHDYPGLTGGEVNPWETTISADGSVSQKVYIRDGWRVKHWKISQWKLARLVTELQTIDFFTLPRYYALKGTDCAKYVVIVTANGRSRQVVFPTCFRIEPSVDRFLSAWIAILRAVPSPNKDETIQFYKQKQSNQELQPTALWRCASRSILISVSPIVMQPRSPSGG
jgi:hypothetical protein